MPALPGGPWAGAALTNEPRTFHLTPPRLRVPQLVEPDRICRRCRKRVFIRPLAPSGRDGALRQSVHWHSDVSGCAGVRRGGLVSRRLGGTAQAPANCQIAMTVPVFADVPDQSA